MNNGNLQEKKKEKKQLAQKCLKIGKVEINNTFYITAAFIVDRYQHRDRRKSIKVLVGKGWGDINK